MELDDKKHFVFDQVPLVSWDSAFSLLGGEIGKSNPALPFEEPWILVEVSSASIRTVACLLTCQIASFAGCSALESTLSDASVHEFNTHVAFSNDTQKWRAGKPCQRKAHWSDEWTPVPMPPWRHQPRLIPHNVADVR